ncbi:MAG TPA: flagellar hook-basal body complex protein FliE [Gammaproteobacteria bacterium]|nr:flagellar hook-basal body complex protein FliE [Gammaproteobacteria bacterium]
MSTINGIDQVLAEMRRLSAAAQGAPAETAAPKGVGEDFSTLLKQSIDKVNETQQTATSLSNAFSAGAPDVELGEVMVALQKASISFQAMTQVRNKLVSAYQEIMSMQV